jgi:hypothetical protein
VAEPQALGLAVEARMRLGEILFPTILFAVVAALIAGGFAAGYSWTVIAFPLGAAIMICGLSAMQVCWAAVGDPRPEPAENEGLPPLAASSLVWVFALAVFVYALGFVFGPAAYLLAYLRAHGSSWALSVIIAAGSIAVTWGLFIKFLQVLLPIEPLWLAP